MKSIALALLGTASAKVDVVTEKAKFDALLTEKNVEATGATPTDAMQKLNKMTVVNVNPSKPANLWWALTVKDSKACGEDPTKIADASFGIWNAAAVDTENLEKEADLLAIGLYPDNTNEVVQRNLADQTTCTAAYAWLIPANAKNVEKFTTEGVQKEAEDEKWGCEFVASFGRLGIQAKK